MSFVSLATLTFHRHELESRINVLHQKCDRAIDDLKKMKMKAQEFPQQLNCDSSELKGRFRALKKSLDEYTNLVTDFNLNISQLEDFNNLEFAPVHASTPILKALPPAQGKTGKQEKQVLIEFSRSTSSESIPNKKSEMVTKEVQLAIEGSMKRASSSIRVGEHIKKAKYHDDVANAKELVNQIVNHRGRENAPQTPESAGPPQNTMPPMQRGGGGGGLSTSEPSTSHNESVNDAPKIEPISEEALRKQFNPENPNILVLLESKALQLTGNWPSIRPAFDQLVRVLSSEPDYTKIKPSNSSSVRKTENSAINGHEPVLIDSASGMTTPITSSVDPEMERRSARVSEVQWNILLDFLISNPDLAKSRGYNNTARGRANSARLWSEVAARLNAEGSGTTKTPKNWSIYVSNYKSKLKKIVADINTDISGTGGGPAASESLSKIDRRFLAILGPDFGLPTAGVGVNPFPDTATRPQQSTSTAAQPSSSIQIPHSDVEATETIEEARDFDEITVELIDEEGYNVAQQLAASEQVKLEPYDIIEDVPRRITVP